MNNFERLLEANKFDNDFFHELMVQLNRWISLADENSLKWIADNRVSIPNQFKKGGTLFRGIQFKTNTEINRLKKGGTINTKGIASWSKMIETPRKFALFLGGGGPFGLIFKRKIPNSNVVLDIEKFYMSREVKKQAIELDIDHLIQKKSESQKEVIVNSIDAKLGIKDVVVVIENGKEIPLSSINLTS